LIYIIYNCNKKVLGVKIFVDKHVLEYYISNIRRYIKMKRKLTLTVDEDLYSSLDELPRRLSVSETVSWMLRYYVEEFKKGRELTEAEFNEFMNTPEGRDFRERFRRSPTVKKMFEVEAKVSEVVKTVKKKAGRPAKGAKRTD
jgi:hypothetical protein